MHRSAAFIPRHDKVQKHSHMRTTLISSSLYRYARAHSFSEPWRTITLFGSRLDQVLGLHGIAVR